jgi:hypothetical protein
MSLCYQLNGTIEYSWVNKAILRASLDRPYICNKGLLAIIISIGLFVNRKWFFRVWIMSFSVHIALQHLPMQMYDYES